MAYAESIATSNITFSLSFLLFSTRNKIVDPLTRW